MRQIGSTLANHPCLFVHNLWTNKVEASLSGFWKSSTSFEVLKTGERRDPSLLSPVLSTSKLVELFQDPEKEASLSGKAGKRGRVQKALLDFPLKRGTAVAGAEAAAEAAAAVS